MANRVAIIGAGVAGLTSIKCAVEAGLEPTAYERDSWLGGIWNYNEDPDRFVAAKSTVVNVSKHFSCYSDFPMPKEMPNYPTGHLFQNYFESYAKHFDLTPRIRFNCKVLKIEKSKDYQETGRWEVHSIKNKQDDGREQEVCIEVYDYVLVCSGVFAKPFTPNIPGIENFSGTKIHSATYKTFGGFEGKRVIVVGLGNTGADIACELSRIAKQVYISTRRGGYVLPRMAAGGLPFDVGLLKRSIQFIPRAILPWLKERTLKSSSYNLANLGLQPNNDKGVDLLLINDELPHRIVTGTLIVKDEIKGYKDQKVFFKDNTELEDIDAIIFATGYDADFPFLSRSIYNPEEAKFGHQLYKAVFPVNLLKPTLAFIGAFRVSGAVIPIVEMQARWAVKVFQGTVTLPSQDVMKEDIAARRARNADLQVKSSASTGPQLLREGFLAYMDDIGSLIGVKPNLWKLFFQDPLLAFKCFFGPAVPAHYRLMGPGAWSGAKQAIENFEENLVTPLKTRPVKDSSTSSSYFSVLILFSLLVLIISIFIFYK